MVNIYRLPDGSLTTQPHDDAEFIGALNQEVPSFAHVMALYIQKRPDGTHYLPENTGTSLLLKLICGLAEEGEDDD